jgi:hypothetical protein
MATRDEIFYFISQNFEFKQVSDMLLKVQLFKQDGRAQEVFIGGNSGEGSQIFMYSHFAHSSDVKAEKALRIASEQSFYGMQLINGFFVLCHSVNSQYMEASDIRSEMGILAIQADEVEKSILGSDDY